MYVLGSRERIIAIAIALLLAYSSDSSSLSLSPPRSPAATPPSRARNVSWRFFRIEFASFAHISASSYSACWSTERLWRVTPVANFTDDVSSTSRARLFDTRVNLTVDLSLPPKTCSCARATVMNTHERTFNYNLQHVRLINYNHACASKFYI